MEHPSGGPSFAGSGSPCVNFLRHVAYQGVFGLIFCSRGRESGPVIEVNPRLTSGFSMEAMIGAWDPSEISSTDF